MDVAILAISIAILLFVAAEFMAAREWKGEVSEWKKGVDKWINEVKGWKNDAGKWQAHTDETIAGALRSINALNLKFDLANAKKDVIRSNSPIELSEHGKAVSRGIGGEKWAQEEMAKHTAALDGKKPHEIQKHCFDYVLDAQDQIVTDEMRAFAYENGHPMGVILMVLAIELRNALTQKRQVLK